MSHVLIQMGRLVYRKDVDRKLDIIVAEMDVKPPFQASLKERIKHYLTPKTWKAKYDLARLNVADKKHDYQNSKKRIKYNSRY